MRTSLDCLGPRMRALSPRDRLFVTLLLETRSATKAARLMGYADGPGSSQANGRGRGAGLRVTASRLTRRPDIAAAIKEEARSRLAIELPRLLPTLEEIVENSTIDGKPVKTELRLHACLLVLTLAGL